MDLGGSVDWLEKNAWSPPLTHFFTVKLSTTEAIKRSTREEKKTEDEGRGALWDIREVRGDKGVCSLSLSLIPHVSYLLL